MMDRGKTKQGGQWSRQGQSFDPRLAHARNPPHKPNLIDERPSTSADNPSLNLFLSGIAQERSNQQRDNAIGNTIPQMSLPHEIHQQRPTPSGPIVHGAQLLGIQNLPGAQVPGALPSGTPQPISQSITDMKWDSHLNPNENPPWQRPPPDFVPGSQSQREHHPSLNWKSQHPTSLHQHHPGTGNNSEEGNTSTFNRSSALPHRPSLFGQTSSVQNPHHQEQHDMSSFARERHHPSSPAQSGQHLPRPPQSGTQQPQAHFSGRHPIPRQNFPDQQYSQQHQRGQKPDSSIRGPHPQQSGPRLLGSHQFRPHLFGQPGEHPHDGPPPRQQFTPQQQRREQYPSDSSFPASDGPHPARPLGPRPPGIQASQHPQGPHPSTSMHQPDPVHSPGPPSHFPSPWMPSPQLQSSNRIQDGPRKPFHIPEQTRQLLPPPPPLHPNQGLDSTRSNLPPQMMPERSQRDKDEEWLRGWLRKNRIGSSRRTNANTLKAITVDEGRHLVSDLIQTLHQLDDLKEMLSCRIESDELSWQHECMRVNRMKEKVEGLQSELFGSEFTDLLQDKMKKKRKRRARIKRQKHRHYQAMQESDDRRKELHLKIDTQITKELQRQQDLKREAELQEEIDKTLYEVRKKKQEASQTLDLIKGLRKLRQLRKDAAQVKGVHTPRELDIDFEQKLKPLEELMSKQRDVYREEEKAMQVMLEEEHEEYKEQEKAKQRRRQEEKAVKEMQAKMKLIFGIDELVRPDDPRFPFEQFYHQAESNMHALVDIRHQWDQFLVPDTEPEGSAIPASWVLPSDPSSPAWTSVLDA